jgi:hypothetical protein
MAKSNSTDRLLNAPSIQKPVMGNDTAGRSPLAAPAATSNGA